MYQRACQGHFDKPLHFLNLETLSKGFSNGKVHTCGNETSVQRRWCSHFKTRACHSFGSNKVEINPGCFLVGACRGGAGGSTATERKRVEKQNVDNQLLAGLADLLKRCEPDVGRPTKGDSRTEEKRIDGKGKVGNVPRLASDVGLLNALQRLVTRAQKKPEGLLGRLRNLFAAAENAVNSGQSIILSLKRLRNRHGEPSKGTSKRAQKGKTNGKSPGKQDKPIEGSPWITVGCGGRPEGKEKGKGKQGARPVSFRLREQGWPNTVVVQKAETFGSSIDKKGTGFPFAVLVSTPEELKVVFGIIHGDAKIRVSVICPRRTNEEVACDEFPDVKFVYDKIPLWDPYGKLITKNVATWNSLTQKVKRSFQVGVPIESRPKGTRPDSLVLRVTMDIRLCSDAAWKRLVAQPGSNLRTWISGVAPASANLILDTWAWELQRGAGGEKAVVKGLVRIKKSQCCWSVVDCQWKGLGRKTVFLGSAWLDYYPTRRPGQKTLCEVDWERKSRNGLGVCCTGREPWRRPWTCSWMEATWPSQHVSFCWWGKSKCPTVGFKKFSSPMGHVRNWDFSFQCRIRQCRFCFQKPRSNGNFMDV